MGKWRCISHKSLSASSSPPRLAESQHQAEQRAEPELLLRIRTWGTRRTDAAPSLANVEDRLFRADTRERDSSSDWHLSVRLHAPRPHTHTQSCFCGCVYCSGFLSISFPRKFTGVWCCAVLSEHRCSVLRRKWQLNCFVLDDLAVHEVGSEGNDVTKLEQLSLIFEHSLMSVFLQCFLCWRCVSITKRKNVQKLLDEGFGSHVTVLSRSQY